MQFIFIITYPKCRTHGKMKLEFEEHVKMTVKINCDKHLNCGSLELIKF